MLAEVVVPADACPAALAVLSAPDVRTAVMCSPMGVRLAAAATAPEEAAPATTGAVARSQGVSGTRSGLARILQPSVPGSLEERRVASDLGSQPPEQIHDGTPF